MIRLLLLALLLVGCAQPAPPYSTNEPSAFVRPPVAEPYQSPITEPPSAVRPSEEVEVAEAAFGGRATWYCGGGSPCTRGYGPSDLIAAIDPTLGIAKGTRLRVHHGNRSVEVLAVDVCACGGTRIIDLSRLAFSRLADPSLGVIDVSVEVVRGVVVRGDPTPPATDR